MFVILLYLNLVRNTNAFQRFQCIPGMVRAGVGNGNYCIPREYFDVGFECKLVVVKVNLLPLFEVQIGKTNIITGEWTRYPFNPMQIGSGQD